MRLGIKRVILIFTTILLLCLLSACRTDKSEQAAGLSTNIASGGNTSTTLEDKIEKPDVSVVIVDSTGMRYLSDREAGSDEAVFFVCNISEENIKTDGKFEYILSTNGEYAAIISYTGTGDVVKFPAKVDNIPVVCISSREMTFANNTSRSEFVCLNSQSIKKLIFPDTVIAIGPEAFYRLENLEEIIFSEALTHIYHDAFANCFRLKRVELPSSLISMDYRAFSECSSLEYLSISDGLENIGSGCFERCSNLQEVYLPDSLIYVNSDAFSSCENLKTIHLSRKTLLHESTFGSSFSELDIKMPELVYYQQTTDDKNDTNPSENQELPDERYIEDFEGYTLRIFDVGSVNNRYYSLFDDEYFQKVIESVSKLYNCSIVEVTSDDYYNDMMLSAAAGVSFCDIAIIPSSQIIGFASSNIIKPWNGNNVVDLSQDWWDQAANERYKINGAQIAISGDFNVNNLACRMCYVYNRGKLDETEYSRGMETYTYSSQLISDAKSGWFGENGNFGVSHDKIYKYTYNGGICGSAFDYYRTMLAGQGIDFLNISDDYELTLSYGSGHGYINYMQGMSPDPMLKAFRQDIGNVLVPVKQMALTTLEMNLLDESMGTSGMSEFKSCDDSLFENGTSTFKIVRLDEVATLRETGMDIGLVTLPGGVYASLADTPTYAVQAVGSNDEYKNLVLLDAIAQYASDEVVPAFTESVIGKRQESDDWTSTYSYNEQMIQMIFDNTYYEFDIGSKGDKLQYLFYKYMLRYDASDIWRDGKLTKERFENAAQPLLWDLYDISYNISEYASSIPVAPPVEPQPAETWAESFFDILSKNDYSGILYHGIDISAISDLTNGNGLGYHFDSIAIHDIIQTYQHFSGDESKPYDDFKNYIDFYMHSDLGRNESTIIERFFYEASSHVKKYPLSYVQNALDYLYGAGMFDARELSNETCCYVSNDGQSLYLQIPHRGSMSISSGPMNYRLLDVSYEDDTAVLTMNIVDARYDHSNMKTSWMDYVNQTVIKTSDIGVSWSNFFDQLAYERIDLDNLGKAKLTLFKDSDGVHIENLRVEKQ